MENNKRIPLDDGLVTEVNGGLLSLKKLDDGYCYLQLRDGDFNIVEQYKIKHGARTVNKLLQEMYWTFDAGSRDVQMLEYLRANGYI